MSDFWQKLTSPFIALAPMEDVTDTVFREIITSLSSTDALHLLFTEFTSTDGLCSDIGRRNVMNRLVVNESERQLLASRNVKLVAQIWGSDPEKFYKSTQLISSLGLFDGIDINMGCPVKKVVKKQCCSALINNPELAKEIVRATQAASSLPVSVKTRIGFNTVITEEWISHLLETKPAAITVHGRTQKMMSTGEADWMEIAKAVELRNQLQSPTKMLGNGDVDSIQKAMSRVSETTVDGVMVGTGVFKNPWMFNTIAPEITIPMRIEVLKMHIQLYESTWGERGNFNVLKRFFKIYLNGFDGAAIWRDKLMNTASCKDALLILNDYNSSSFVSR